MSIFREEEINPDQSQAVNNIVTALTRMIEMLKIEDRDPDQWLITLYQSHKDRMLSDNERIWRIGAIFIPISMSAFGVLVTLKNIQIWQILCLGLASTSLIWIWNIIAENHRGFQQKSEAWIQAIHKILNIHYVDFSKVDGNLINRTFIGKGGVQRMRWLLSVCIPIIWLIILVIHGVQNVSV